jgi:hypothetical protein
VVGPQRSAIKRSSVRRALIREKPEKLRGHGVNVLAFAPGGDILCHELCRELRTGQVADLLADLTKRRPITRFSDEEFVKSPP